MSNTLFYYDGVKTVHVFKFHVDSILNFYCLAVTRIMSIFPQLISYDSL